MTTPAPAPPPAPQPMVGGPYCTQSDVELALGRALPPDKDVTTLIGSASDLIDGYLKMSVSQIVTTDPSTGISVIGGFPPLVIRVCAEVVANVINRPLPHVPVDQPDPYNAPAFQYLIGPQALGPWLNQSQQLRLNRLRRHLRSMEMFSETTGFFVRYGIADLTTSMQFDMYDIDEVFLQQLQ